MNALRAIFATAGVLLLASLTASCAAAGGDDGRDTVDIGLLLPLSGALEALGDDAQDGFELYLDLNDGQLGGQEVDVTIADEGDGPDTSIPAADKLLKQDEVDALVGTTSSANYVAVAPETTAMQVPLLGIGGQPDLDQAGIEPDWLWQTSYTSSDPGTALAPYLADEIDGSVYAIGPDFEGGHGIVSAFVEPFREFGGELANPGDVPTWTPWPETTDFVPYLNEIANSDPEAIFAFYAGTPAIDFVTQYAQSDAADIPLYGAFLTEGPVLEAQGAAAEGVHTAMNYSPSIDNDANATFVDAWSQQHPDRQTNLFSMAGWDAALVLDEAIATIDGEVTSAAINEAIAGLDTIESPRGSWQLSEQTRAPVQPWYLRTVAEDGDEFTNVIVEELDPVG